MPTTAEEEEEGDVVGVFGEIVEDPIIVQPLDPCEDPTVIREEVKRLNRKVVQGFVSLVQDLVHRPAENK
jgi:mediator of RNA polymerase II transcription subunit 7